MTEEALTPIERMEGIIARHLAADPHYYDDPNAPKQSVSSNSVAGYIQSQRFLTPNEVRRLAESIQAKRDGTIRGDYRPLWSSASNTSYAAWPSSVSSNTVIG